MSKLLDRRAVLQAQIDKIDITLDKLKGNRTLPCACGKNHKIKDLTLIVSHWYVSPHGCMGGDYYNEGEKSFICPDNAHARNRISDNNLEFKVEYSKRSELANNIVGQFMNNYQRKFKDRIDVYDDKYKEIGVTRSFWCKYLGTKAGMKKFDLSIRDIQE